MLTVCRLVEKKGVDTLIRAVADVPTAHLTVAGDGPEQPNLLELARRLGCENRVDFLGSVDNPAVRQLMQQADLFALPCRTDRLGDRDGIPVALMEAMADGLCVIAGDLPAIRELITPGVNGLLIDENDHAALADILRSSTAELRHKLGHAARQTIENEFSLTLNVDRLQKAMQNAE